MWIKLTENIWKHWTIDMEISKVDNIFWIIKVNGEIEIQFIVKFLRKIECPEIKLDNVQDRIINLINSIITIKCIRGLGEWK